MNIKTLIEDTIKEFDESTKPLSAIIIRCLRISNYLDDTNEIVWIEYNTKDLEELKDDTDYKKK